MSTLLLTKSSNTIEDYIDMEIISFNSSSSLKQSTSNREFEFQMCSNEVGPTADDYSPADELFYKGKLLPLHLLPRLQMVQKLILQNPINGETESAGQQTPLLLLSDSCQSESRRLSCDEKLNLDECFFEWSVELGGFINGDVSLTKKSTKASLSQKIKSLFNISKSANQENVSKVKDWYMRVAKIKNGKRFNFKSPSNNNNHNNVEEYCGIINCVDNHRRSFSGAIQRHYCSKKILSSSSSSSSSNSSGSSSSSSSFSFGLYDLQSLKRSISAKSAEIGNSIEGAIAHCKQSQSDQLGKII